MVDIHLPSKSTINFASKCISRLNFIFKLEGSLQKGYHLDLSSIDSVDIFGIMLTMKFIEFASTKECFEKPELSISDKGAFEKAIENYGFDQIIQDYVNFKNPTKRFKKLKIISKEAFLIAPHSLIRGQQEVKQEFDSLITKALIDFYGRKSIDFVENVLALAVEISSNFYNHAVDDSKTLLIARGTKGSFEIACIDTAMGIPSSLRKLTKYNDLEAEELLTLSVKKEVTSKPNSSHMGYGLWLVSQIVLNYRGRLEIFSDSAAFSINKGKTEAKQHSFWRGTIIYVKIPYKNGINLGNILRKERRGHPNNLGLNFENTL